MKKKIMKILFLLLSFFLSIYIVYAMFLYLFFGFKKTHSNNNILQNYFINNTYDIEDDPIYRIYNDNLKQKISLNNIQVSRYYKVIESLSQVEIYKKKYYYIELNYFHNFDEILSFSSQVASNYDQYIDFDFISNNGAYILYLGPYQYGSEARNEFNKLTSSLYSPMKIVYLNEFDQYQNVIYLKNMLQ